jgi:hypothetical protein
MSEQTMKMSEGWAVVATIDPDAYTAGAQLSDAIDMADYTKLMAVVAAGTLGTNATIDAAATQATTAAGTYKALSPAKAITQLTQAGTDQSDLQAIINVDEHDLDLDLDYRFVKFSLTVGTATSDAGMIVLGLPKSRPATANDLASVTEVV